MAVTYPTRWKPEDLHVGMVIYNPPMQEVDPKTRTCNGTLARFEVMAEGGASLRPYHGPKEAVMPPTE